MINERQFRLAKQTFNLAAANICLSFLPQRTDYMPFNKPTLIEAH